MAESIMTIARAIAELNFGGKRGKLKDIAARYGVTERTVQNWRARVDGDKEPELTRLYRAAIAAKLEGWRSRGRELLVTLFDSIEKDLPSMAPGEKLQAARMVLDAELQAVGIARRTGITVDEAPAYPPPEPETKRLDS